MISLRAEQFMEMVEATNDQFEPDIKATACAGLNGSDRPDTVIKISVWRIDGTDFHVWDNTDVDGGVVESFNPENTAESLSKEFDAFLQGSDDAKINVVRNRTEISTSEFFGY